MTFLKSEYGEGQLEFFLEAESLMEMTDMSQKMDMAKDVYQRYLVNGGGGGTVRVHSTSSAPVDQISLVPVYSATNTTTVNHPGIGAQERTKETQKLWDTVAVEHEVYVDGTTAMAKVNCDLISPTAMLLFMLLSKTLGQLTPCTCSHFTQT